LSQLHADFFICVSCCAVVCHAYSSHVPQQPHESAFPDSHTVKPISSNSYADRNFAITVLVVHPINAHHQCAFHRLPSSDIILAPRPIRAIPASDVAFQHHDEYLIVMVPPYIANRFPHTFTSFGEFQPQSCSNLYSS
jgi:hypothetical protein